MAPHLTHIGVHDHGFNNISTYGTLWRLMREGKIAFSERELDSYELALKVSGAVQAARWTSLPYGQGYIYSFNGPQSLFVDTLRSLRSLAVAHQLGHVLMAEGDTRISLLDRLLLHAETTAQYNIYYGKRRDAYDVAGRVAHESIFNPNDGTYRCPSTQQGYSPFSTWTRGLAWAILGFAEQLEFLSSGAIGFGISNLKFEISKSARTRNKNPASKFDVSKSTGMRSRKAVLNHFAKAATVTADFYLANCCSDGIPMWDTGAPNLERLDEYLSKPADPFNRCEPVDSSAAVIAAQGLLRLGNYFSAHGSKAKASGYRQAGLTIANTVFEEPYLSANRKHQGLILHSVYHRPNGWDYVAPGQKVPNGESSMWGDYHARELALMLLREIRGEPYLVFFDPGQR
jgi:hypothetical protein